MPRGAPKTVDDAVLRIKGIPRREETAKKLWEMKQNDRSGWNAFLAQQTPERRRGANLYVDGYQKILSEQGLLGRAVSAVRRGVDALGEAGADVLEQTIEPQLVKGARWAETIPPKAVQAYKGIERATGFDLPGGGTRQPRPGPGGIPLPGTPARRGAATALQSRMLSALTLHAVPASKFEEWEERNRAEREAQRKELGHPQFPVEMPTGEHLEEAEMAGEALGLASWFTKYGPGGLIHASGAGLSKLAPAARPIARAMLKRVGEAAPLAVGAAAGAAQEGATLKETGLTAAKTAAAWMVFAPIIEGVLGGLAAPIRKQAERRAESRLNEYLKWLQETEGRAPGEAEAKAAGERVARQEANRVVSVTQRHPPSIRPQLFNERAAARDVRQTAELRSAFAIDAMEPKPLIGEKKLQLPEISEWEQFSEGLMRTQDEMAIFGSKARPKLKPEPTLADTMAQQADERAAVVAKARERGITKAQERELEVAVSEAEVPTKPPVAAPPAQEPIPAPKQAPEAAARAEAAVGEAVPPARGEPPPEGPYSAKSPLTEEHTAALNAARTPEGRVRMYHGTTEAGARQVQESGALRGDPKYGSALTTMPSEATTFAGRRASNFANEGEPVVMIFDLPEELAQGLQANVGRNSFGATEPVPSEFLVDVLPRSRYGEFHAATPPSPPAKVEPPVGAARPVPATRKVTAEDLQRPGATTTEDIDNLVMSPRVQQRETGMEKGVLNRKRVQEIHDKFDPDLYTAPTIVTPENAAEFAPFYRVPRTPDAPLVEVPVEEVVASGLKVIDVGHHRTTRMAWAGEGKVSVRDAGSATLERAQTINAVEQLISKDLNPLERARSWRMLAERGATHEQLAGGNFKPEHVQQHIDILNIPSEDVLADVATGTMNWRVAAGMGRAIRDQGPELFNEASAQAFAKDLKTGGFQGEGTAYNFVTTVTEAAKRLEGAGDLPAGGVEGVAGGQGAIPGLDVPRRTVNVSGEVAKLMAESRAQASIARLARKMAVEKPKGRMSALRDVSASKLEADAVAAETRVAEIDSALASGAAGDRAAQDKLMDMIRTKPEPPGDVLFTAATGEMPVAPPRSGPRQPSATAMKRTKGGGRGKTGAALLPPVAADEALADATVLYGKTKGKGSELFSSTGTMARSTGPSGREAMAIKDQGIYFMNRYRGYARERASEAVADLKRRRTPRLTAPLAKDPEPLRGVLRAIEGKRPVKSLNAGQRKAYTKIKSLMDELGIAPMEDGITTIRALDDITLADGTVIPRTGEGPDVYSNMRLAKGQVNTVSQLKTMREVPIQMVDPMTGEVLPEIHYIPQSQVQLPARSNYLRHEFDPKYLRGGKLEHELERALVKAGRAKNLQDARLFIRRQKSARLDPLSGSYRYQREDITGLNEKFYLPAEQRLAKYIDGATRHLAWGRTAGAGTSLKQEGWKFEEAVDRAMVTTKAGTEEEVLAEGVQEFLNRGWAADVVEAERMLTKLRSHFLDATRADFGMAVEDAAREIGKGPLGFLRSVVASGSLQRVMETNLSQPWNTAALAGWRNLGSAVLQSFNGLTRQEMRELGVTVTHGLEASLGISGDVWHQRLARWIVTQGYGLGPMENWLRTTAAIASRKHAADSFKRLLERPGDPWALEALRILRIDGAKAAQRGYLLEDELMEAAYWGAAETQYLTNMTDMPVWYSTEGGRTLAQFLGFTYQQGKLMQKMFLRDAKDPAKFAKLMGTLFIGMPMFGELAIGTKGLISQEPRTSSWKRRYIEDLIGGGSVHMALDMMWEAAFASDHGDMFAGAAAGQLGEFVGNTWEVLGITDLADSTKAVPRTPAQAAAADARAQKWFAKKAPIPHGFGRAIINEKMPSKSMAHAPWWMRAVDTGQSIFHPRSKATNIWELNARWTSMDPKMKVAHWKAMSPGDRVNHFIKLDPAHRGKWMSELGKPGMRRFAIDVSRLGDMAKERVRWAVADEKQYRADKAAEKAKRDAEKEAAAVP